MAVETLSDIAGNLLAHGRPADEPAAVVQWATTPRQRTVLAPLSEIALAAADLGSPAVLVVGPTAALASRCQPGAAATREPAAAVAAAVPSALALAAGALA